MGSLFSRAMGFWGGLTGPSRRLIIGAGAIFLVGIFLLMRFTGQVEYATLTSGVDARDASAITAELDALGVTYRLAEGGGTIEVPAEVLDQTRLDLASSNVLSGANVGFEIFDKSNLGATDFTNRVNLVRAMEGELSRTIGRLDQVSSATVKIAMPEEELFTSEQDPVTAGVVLALGAGGELDAGQVQGITRLVANAVPGLETENVTVTDSQGNILDAADDEVSGAGAAAERLALEQRYEQGVQQRLDAMIAAVLGPGMAVVQVDAALDLDQVTTDEETYDPDSTTPLETEESNETLESDGAAAGAPAGAAANTPGGPAFPAAAGGGGTTDYEKETRRQTNGVDRTRSQIQRAEGAVTRQSIAVQVSDEVPVEVVATLEESVAAAVGLEDGRDQLSVVSVPFAEDGTARLAAAGATEPAAAEEAGGGMAMADIVKTAGAVLGVLILALLTWRSLRRRQGALERALPELLKGGPVPMAELSAHAATPIEPAAAEPARRLEGQSKSPVEQQMEDLAMRRPDDVAQLVRGWLLEKR